jgi:2',3'-cyclic-nucleotide 2'-phosphodiesterase/3'-nucleotidase
VQLEVTGADISFAAPQAVSGTISAGKVCVRDLFRMVRYEDFLYTMKLSGKEILNYLEYSYGLWFNQMKSPEDHLLLLREGESARSVLMHPSYNFDSAAGICYTVDVSQPAGRRVTITVMQDGKPFDESETYTVALNFYRGSGGGGHLTQGAGIDPEKLQQRIISSTLKDFRSQLMDYIQSKKVVHPLPGNNWQVIPVDFYEAGAKRDRLYFR